MKLRVLHIVPLARQSVDLIRQLQPLTGSGRFVFASLRSLERPMSENCITAALRRMGYTGDEMTWHGFRALASTQLNELDWDDDWIEAQLAHTEKNKVRGDYNFAKYLPQRRVMMQAWADYLDELCAGKGSAASDTAADRAAAAAAAALHMDRPHGRHAR
jgi:integrase